MKIFLQLLFFAISLNFISCGNLAGNNNKEERFNPEILRSNNPAASATSVISSPSNIWNDFAYKVLLFQKGELFGAGSCFFIKTTNKTYLVTARHLLYEDAQSKDLIAWRGYDQMTFLVFNEQTQTTRPCHIQVSPNDPKINAVILNGHFVDMLFLELFLPAELNLKFVDFKNLPDTAILHEGTSAVIVGFPSGDDTATVVQTTLSKYYRQERGFPASVLCLNHESVPGVSGGPVFTADPKSPDGRPIFLGIYTGFVRIQVGTKLLQLGAVTNGKILSEIFH